MSIIAKSSENESRYPEVPTGVHKARCVNVIDLGTQESNYDGQLSYKRQCLIIWETPNEKNSYEEPITISKFYTLSLHEKSNLGIDLVSWRGRPFTELEKKGFDISNLLTATCYINVMEGKNGRPRITSIMPLPKDEIIPEQFHPSLMFSIDEYQKNNRESFNLLSEGIRKIILRSKELSDNENMGNEHNGEDFNTESVVPF
tara:strand:- start:272 stop:877 length:606 start_codon:yes stop_codon:yes gene_type:complete